MSGIPTCTEADTPPVDRITDACKNITLATTSLRPVIKYSSLHRSDLTEVVYGNKPNSSQNGPSRLYV